MADQERISSTSGRMTAEEITQRGFASKVRGISETEVRSFLKRVADEVQNLTKREEELLSKISELQAALKEKPKATKAELLEYLGEQTTRVLSSAESAAEQMLNEAKEQAESLVANAKETSENILSKAQSQANAKESDAETKARILSENAKREVENIINEAKAKGREIFQESVVVREQILKDLLRRRDLLLEQIDELRNGREELLDSYKIVKGSFQKATEALHSVEEKASSELLANPIDVDDLLKTPVDLPSSLDPASKIEISSQENSESSVETDKTTNEEENVKKIDDEKIQSSTKIEEEESFELTGKKKKIKSYVKEALGVGEEPEVITPGEEKTQDDKTYSAVTPIGAVSDTPKKKDVGALFQSLKQQNENDETEPEKEVEETVDLVKEEKVEAKSDKKSSKKKSAKKDPIALRDEAISEVATTILRKAKRQLQDEQNELLEALRTIKPKKRVAAENILPDEQTQIKTWEEAIRSELEIVFQKGASRVTKEKVTYDEDLIKAGVSWIVNPLRETLTIAIDEGDQADATSRVGARYREWRNSDLKNALNDAMCSAYNNGVVKGANSDSTMQWVVEKAGQCPDADDNALEPTKNGEAFPTGQVCPPAHSGCRCVITVA